MTVWTVEKNQKTRSPDSPEVARQNAHNFKPFSSLREKVSRRRSRRDGLPAEALAKGADPPKWRANFSQGRSAKISNGHIGAASRKGVTNLFSFPYSTLIVVRRFCGSFVPSPVCTINSLSPLPSLSISTSIQITTAD